MCFEFGLQIWVILFLKKINFACAYASDPESKFLTRMDCGFTIGSIQEHDIFVARQPSITFPAGPRPEHRQPCFEFRSTKAVYLETRWISNRQPDAGSICRRSSMAPDGSHHGRWCAWEDSHSAHWSPETWRTNVSLTTELKENSN